ncbi:MAG: 3-isopropylmalate dehydratase large subunit [Clostridiales Family XIII bacterium]|jgi:3-isopropylmalate/(R)-2-methylmalate dehydratase large subunit|nr:3-isopropylmalate dehydratase large subunit [Clostridiales Family XIII bacterium]
MRMTMTQKILAAHAGLKQVKAGQFIEAKLDIVLANDITGPPAIKEFEKMGAERVFDVNKVVLVPDHFTPNKDIKAAEQCKILRAFAAAQGIAHYFEVGEMGIEHALLPEKGLVVAGDAVIGADSHTCTYGALGAFATGIGSTDMAAGMAAGKAWFKVPAAIRFELTGRPGKWVSGKDVILHIIGRIGVDGALYKSMEFMGPGLRHLSMDDRLAMANMAIEAGAKNGIFAVDEKTRAYMKEHRNKNKALAKRIRVYAPDEDADYERTIHVDLSKIRPTVAFPHLPENTRTIDEVGSVKIDQVVIGSCTNGRYEDMKIAAKILKGRRVAQGVRCLIFPGTQRIYLDCVRDGFAEIFVRAGAVLSTPTCGPCLGGHSGILAAGERAISTTNRNFVGRMGHTDSEVYLASPAVAAASAVKGYIANPEEV